MLITIGGVSRSGKTSLAHYLRHLLGHHRSCIISQDHYPNHESEIPTINGITDWEVPASLDLKVFWDEVIKARQAHTYVLAEGLFIYDRPIGINPHVEMHVNISRTVFEQRRSSDERWGKDESWYINHVWNSYLKFGQPPGEVIHLSGSQPFPFVRVTKDAWVWCSACNVFIHKIVDHKISKFLTYINDKVVKAHLDCHFPGIIDRIQAAATCFLL